MKYLSIFLLFASSPVLANFHCEVEIKRVMIYGNGGVTVFHTGRNDFTEICNLSLERESVSVTTCAMWASMLQNIQNNNGKAVFYYHGEGSCASLATYTSSPAPVYISSKT